MQLLFFQILMEQIKRGMEFREGERLMERGVPFIAVLSPFIIYKPWPVEDSG